MLNLLKTICDDVETNLSELTWKCEGCSEIARCEIDSSKNGTSKYCLPIITAAIMSDRKFTPPSFESPQTRPLCSDRPAQTTKEKNGKFYKRRNT